eukprot:Opistho-1_new@40994
MSGVNEDEVAATLQEDAGVEEYAYDDTNDRELLKAAGEGRLDDVQRLIDEEGADLVYQCPETGFTPLHAAAAAGHAEVVNALLELGHPYNLVDSAKRTAAEVASENGHSAIYERLLDEGIRAELILSVLERKRKRDGDSEDGDANGERKRTAPPPNKAYLEQPLKYSEGKLLDAENNGVMMGWELPLMERHAKVICPREGLDVLNVGFGLGLIDMELQKHKPKSHTIVEAHPDVYAHMLASGWGSKPGVRIVFGRWQDVLDQLDTYDGIFFDTFGEFYEDQREFHEAIPRLLRKGGVYSFFNGLGATNPFFHDMYCRIAAMDLSALGISTHYESLPMDAEGDHWEGVKGKYWTLKTYLLPTCTHKTGDEEKDPSA